MRVECSKCHVEIEISVTEINFPNYGYGVNDFSKARAICQEFKSASSDAPFRCKTLETDIEHSIFPRSSS